MKKILSFVLVLGMILSLGAGAFADGGQDDYTVENGTLTIYVQIQQLNVDSSTGAGYVRSEVNYGPFPDVTNVEKVSVLPFFDAILQRALFSVLSLLII